MFTHVYSYSFVCVCWGGGGGDVFDGHESINFWPYSVIMLGLCNVVLSRIYQYTSIIRIYHLAFLTMYLITCLHKCHYMALSHT